METKKKLSLGEFIKKWALVIIIPFLLLSTFKSCDTNSDVSRLRKENKVLVTTLDSLKVATATEKEVINAMEEVMLDFLIYEDELDKKKITISQIKDKIKTND